MVPDTLRGKCPICGQGPLKPIPLGFNVFVEKPSGKQHVGGLVAFQCEEEGHVFFVMSKDVEQVAA